MSRHAVPELALWGDTRTASALGGEGCAKQAKRVLAGIRFLMTTLAAAVALVGRPAVLGGEG
jgi:hypothetical protein